MSDPRSPFDALPKNERRVFDLEGSRIEEVGFDPAKGWSFYVTHRGCDDDAAILVVAPEAVHFKYPEEAING